MPENEDKKQVLIEEGAIAQMRSLGGTWAVYQNMAMDSQSHGQFRFLKYGANAPFKTPPKRFPDTKDTVGWKFGYVGLVDLQGGWIVYAERPMDSESATDTVADLLKMPERKR